MDELEFDFNADYEADEQPESETEQSPEDFMIEFWDGIFFSDEDRS